MAILDFGTAAMVLGIFGLVLCYLARDIIGWPRRLCVALLASEMTCSVADMLFRAAPRYQTPIPVYRALLVIQSLTTPIPTLLVVAYILYCCGEDYRKSVLLRVLFVFSGLMAVIASVSQLVCEIGPAPDYELQMELLPILLFAFSMALFAFTLIALFRGWKKLTNAQRVMFLLSFLASRSAVIFFVEFLLVYDLICRYLAQQKENEQQRTRIAVAQMRPHFIYNTLMSIYYLCAEDTEKTQRVIRDFNRYLQSNFTAIAEEKPILFDKELDFDSSRHEIKLKAESDFSAEKLPLSLRKHYTANSNGFMIQYISQKESSLWSSSGDLGCFLDMSTLSVIVASVSGIMYLTNQSS